MIETKNRHEIISIVPKDEIELVDNHFIGSAFFIKEDAERNLTIHRENFNTIKTETLPDFFYNKPIVEPDKDPFNKNSISIFQETSPRSGYFLIKIVENVKRVPNHLYEPDNGIICAISKDNKWETRYFPKKSLHSDFWELVTK